MISIGFFQLWRRTIFTIGAFLFLCNYGFSQLEERPLVDKNVIMALKRYKDLLREPAGDKLGDYHFVVNVYSEGSRDIVYTWTAISINDFWNNMPEAYSKFDGHLVFWYSEKQNQLLPNEGFEAFYHQFKDNLIINRHGDGTLDGEADLKVISYESIGPYRFVIENGKLCDVREVMFPGRYFYRAGFIFDKKGRIMFEDGAYKASELDKPHKPLSGKALGNCGSFGEYVVKNSKVPERILDSNRISAMVTIDKKGSVIKVDVKVEKGEVSEEIKEKIKQTLLKMPKWEPAKVNGRRVCYKESIGL